MKIELVMKRIKKNYYQLLLMVLILSLTLLSSFSYALQKPSPDEIEQLKQSGEYENRVKLAKEIGNDKIDKELFKKAKNKAKRLALTVQGFTSSEINQIAPLYAPPPAWRGMPTKGNIKVFALLIDFPDFPSVTTKDTVHSRLFGSGTSSLYPYESLANYYTRSSYNQLNLSTGITLGWYRPKYNRSAINMTDAGRDSLIKEAINYYKSQGINFAQFDNDNDGVIDYFIVIWSGPDNGWANFWWGKQVYFSDGNYTIDGKKFGKYSWQWEGRPFGSPFSPQVAIHETGHALGLPDYYDYDVNIGPDGGVGGLDMMDSNWGDHNCFSKWILDWIEPVVVSSGSSNIALNPSSTNKDAVLIMPNISLTNEFDEYFLVQNRDKGGNDRYYLNEGLLIWHIDATLDRNGTNYLYNNSYSDHKLIRLMEADGLESIEGSSSPANAGDYYLPGKSFNSSSTPSSLSYSDLKTGVSIGNIARSGWVFSADFAIDSCNYSISPNSVSVPATGTSGNISVASSTGFCTWTANTDSPWLTVNSNPNGIGNGTVPYSVAANEGDNRTGTITVAGKTFTVVQAGLPPVANFTASTTSAVAPFVVKFTDQSQRVTSRHWDFGDGTSSTEQNPIHTYTTRGTYNVTLTASNSAGVSSITKKIVSFIDITSILNLLLND